MKPEHHILLPEPNDAAVMAGSHVKRIKHGDSVQIWTSRTVGKGTNRFSPDKGPKKLHVIIHGGHTTSFSHGTLGFNLKTLAEHIYNSGLPNNDQSKVRLDTCFSGLGNTDSVAHQLAQELDRKYWDNGKGSNQVAVVGVMGASTLGWSKPKERGGRAVAKPNSTSTDKMRKAFTDVGKKHKPFAIGLAKHKLGVWYPKFLTYGDLLDEASALCTNLEKKSSNELVKIAKEVYGKVGKYFKKFHQAILKDATINLKADHTKTKGDYKQTYY